MSNIENLGVTLEDYLAGLAAGIDILELKDLENQGIPRVPAQRTRTPAQGTGTATS